MEKSRNYRNTPRNQRGSSWGGVIKSNWSGGKERSRKNSLEIVWS